MAFHEAEAVVAAGVGEALAFWRRRQPSALFWPVLTLAMGCGPSTDGTGAGQSSPPFDWLGRTVPTTDAQAMTVEVDPDATLTISPAQGVGVFVEYRAGGHWRLSWSCDTSLSGEACPYQVAITTHGGPLSNVVALVSADEVTQPSPQEVDASTVTTTTLDGVTLDAPAGTSISLNVLLDGAKDGVSMFFVQGGAVNGGYSGALTDPLVFEPSSP